MTNTRDFVLVGKDAPGRPVKVFCVGELADQGAGHPDFGLYAAKQVQRCQPREGQTPERGVVEVKSTGDGDQVIGTDISSQFPCRSWNGLQPWAPLTTTALLSNRRRRDPGRRAATIFWRFVWLV